MLDIVTADIPALLGMDVMGREGLKLCTICNRLAKRVRTNVGGKKFSYTNGFFP